METISSPSPEEKSRRGLAYGLLVVGCILSAVAYFVGITDNPTGIVSMLLGAFGIVSGLLLRFGRSWGHKPGQQLLYWAPRALCIIFALFTSIFALDVFDQRLGFWETADALFMHLIPTFLIFVLLAVSWRWEWIGGVFFIGMAVLYVVTMWDRSMIWWVYVLIAGPLTLIGILFLINWYHRDSLRNGLTGGSLPLWLLPTIVVAGLASIAILYAVSLPKTESVTFRIEAPAARQVFVAGTFNGWNPRQYPLSQHGQGQWETTISLQSGRYQYKFIVDSMWVHDVNNPNRVELTAPYSGYNSVVTVGSEDSLTSHQ
jgi:hypothetical protein